MVAALAGKSGLSLIIVVDFFVNHPQVCHGSYRHLGFDHHHHNLHHEEMKKSESEFLIVKTETQSMFQSWTSFVLRIGMMPWSQNLLQWFFVVILRSSIFWVPTKVLLKESGWCLDRRICCKPYTASPPGPAPTLTLHLPFFANSSFFHFSTLQHFTFFASTFRIFRQTFPFYFCLPPPFLPLRLSLCAESGRAAAVSV